MQIKIKNQSPEVLYKRRCVLKNFTKFTGRQLHQSLFLNKVATLLKKETVERMFSFEFCEIVKNTYFTEHLRATASEN